MSDDVSRERQRKIAALGGFTIGQPGSPERRAWEEEVNARIQVFAGALGGFTIAEFTGDLGRVGEILRDGAGSIAKLRADAELGFARLTAVLGPCAHPDAVPVELATGEIVAWLCPACDRQLPAGWDTLQR